MPTVKDDTVAAASPQAPKAKKPTSGPSQCPKCDKVLANKGLLGLHLKTCDGGQKQEKPAQAALPPIEDNAELTEERIAKVCEAMRDGMPLEQACYSVGVEPKLFHDCTRRVASGKCSDQDRQVVMRTRQAEAVFQRDLLNRLNDPDPDKKGDVAAAKVLADMMKERLRQQRNLPLQYDATILLDIVRRHVTPEQFRAVLMDVSELDPEVAVYQLDERLALG